MIFKINALCNNYLYQNTLEDCFFEPQTLETRATFSKQLRYYNTYILGHNLIGISNHIHIFVKLYSSWLPEIACSVKIMAYDVKCFYFQPDSVLSSSLLLTNE